MRIYTPEGDGPFPALVYFHGSGWVVLNIEVCDTTMRALANSTGCVVVAVNYQKAPEHPFPVPFDDCWAAPVWTVENAEELNVDPARIAVGGDSAGGNLAAAVAMQGARRGRAGDRLPGADLPGRRPRLGHAVRARERRGLPAPARVDALVLGPLRPGQGADDDPRVSPLRAASLAGLPPAFIVTAEFDPLRDDGRAYPPSCTTRASGHLRRVRRMIHGFYWMQAVVDRAATCTQEVAQEVRDALHAG